MLIKSLLYEDKVVEIATNLLGRRHRCKEVKVGTLGEMGQRQRHAVAGKLVQIYKKT